MSKFKPIIEQALRAWEKIPPSEVTRALGITPGNATTKKAALTSRVREIWKVFDYVGVQIWAVPDQPQTVQAIANLPSPHRALQQMVFYFALDANYEELSALVALYGAQALSIERKEDKIVATLIFNQPVIFL